MLQIKEGTPDKKSQIKILPITKKITTSWDYCTTAEVNLSKCVIYIPGSLNTIGLVGVRTHRFGEHQIRRNSVELHANIIDEKISACFPNHFIASVARIKIDTAVRVMIALNKSGRWHAREVSGLFTRGGSVENPPLNASAQLTRLPGFGFTQGRLNERIALTFRGLRVAGWSRSGAHDVLL